MQRFITSALFGLSLIFGSLISGSAFASILDQGNIPYALPYTNSTLGCTHDKVLAVKYDQYSGITLFFYYGCSGYDQTIVYDLNYSGGTIKRTPTSSQMKTTIFTCSTNVPSECSVNNQTTGSTQYEDPSNNYISINNTIYDTNSGVYLAEKKVFGTTIFDSAFEEPLAGFPGTINLAYGANWSFGQCPGGTDKLHSGLDVAASVGDDIFAAEAGTVKDIFTGQHGTWGDAIVIEHTSGYRTFTTVYWHVEKYGSLAVNNTVTKSQHIADVYNLGGNTHFHFGIRMGSYDADNSLAGALPTTACGSNPTYPAFPESFIDPASGIYQ